MCLHTRIRIPFSTGAKRGGVGSRASAVPPTAEMPCPLCPLFGGAYKRLTATLAGNPPPRDHRGLPVRSAGFCHAVCAVWNPIVSFGDVRRMEPVRVRSWTRGS